MELRVLEYFLALTREGSISAAAKALNVSQPTLSRQLIDLERELGCNLFERSKQGIILTDDGMLLRRRAGEITQLVHATESELQLSHDTISGVISIGCAETHAMDLIAELAKDIHDEYPEITFNVVSDIAENVAENINKGLLDFGLMLRKPKPEGLDYLPLNCYERSIVIMRTDSPLAEKESLKVEDLLDVPLILPSSYRHSGILGDYRGKEEGGILHTVATHNLAYNGIRLVEAGLGVAVTIEGLGDFVNVYHSHPLTYRFVEDIPPMNSYLAWKPFQFRSNACKLFLERARARFAPIEQEPTEQNPEKISK